MIYTIGVNKDHNININATVRQVLFKWSLLRLYRKHDNKKGSNYNNKSL